LVRCWAAPGPVRLRLHDHERLGLVGGLVVGAVLRVALLGQDVLHLRELQQGEAGVAEQVRAPVQRNGARRGDGDVDVALIHLRQELGPQLGDQRQRPRQHEQARHARGDRIVEGDAQRAEVVRAQPYQEGRVLLSDLAVLEQHGRERRDAEEREQERAHQRERVGQRDRTEDAPLDPLEREDRHHRRGDDRHREQRRTDHLLGRVGNHRGHALGLRTLLGQMAVDVLDQDHRAVEQDAEVHRAHGQKVGGHAGVVEAHEGRQERERHRHRHGERAAEGAQEQPQDQRHQDGTLEHVSPDRVEGGVDELRAIVEGHDAHPLGEHLAVDPIDGLVHGRQDVARVLAAPEKDGPFDRVELGAAGHGPAGRRIGLDHARDVADQDGRAVVRADDGVRDVLGGLQVPPRAHHQLGLTALEVAARGRTVRLIDRVDQIAQPEVHRAQLRGVGEHVIFLDEPSEADDVGDARHAAQVLRDDPLLPGAQLARVVVVALQRVLEDLAHWRVVRSQARRDAGRDLGVGQALGDLLARPVDVDVVLEGQDHLRQPERGDRPLHQHARRAGQGALDGDGDLLLDLLRRLAGVEGDHHDLHVGHVGEGLDLQLRERVDAEDGERRRDEQREDAPVNGKIYESVQHRGGAWLWEERDASLPPVPASDMPPPDRPDRP